MAFQIFRNAAEFADWIAEEGYAPFSDAVELTIEFMNYIRACEFQKMNIQQLTYALQHIEPITTISHVEDIIAANAARAKEFTGPMGSTMAEEIADQHQVNDYATLFDAFIATLKQ